MKISNVYIQEEGNKQYYRFGFKGVIHSMYSSFMLHYTECRITGSMLSNLHEYNSLSKVKAYETIRS